MTRNGDIGEFKGLTKQSLIDLREDVRTIQQDIARINRWLIGLTLLTAMAVIERLPAFIQLVGARY